ncbi:hypothetical protein, partial [Xanthobacter autotrophicus]|uniref:hypothetical protein n=1 Tax=Xanthobacter autotrophicus TaxID=280 RepID=UPI00372ADD54
CIMALNLTNPTGAHKGSCALAPLRCAHQRHHAGGPHVAEVAVEEPRPFFWPASKAMVTGAWAGTITVSPTGPEKRRPPMPTT